jgi:hypothetical protein
MPEVQLTTVSTQQSAAIFVEVADTLIAEVDLVEFLHLLTYRAADLVNAAAVGLLLADQRGRLEFMAGSNENVKLLELFQPQNREGPCLEAFHTGQPLINVDLEEAFPAGLAPRPGRSRPVSSPCTPSDVAYAIVTDPSGVDLTSPT